MNTHEIELMNMIRNASDDADWSDIYSTTNSDALNGLIKQGMIDHINLSLEDLSGDARHYPTLRSDFIFEYLSVAHCLYYLNDIPMSVKRESIQLRYAYVVTLLIEACTEYTPKLAAYISTIGNNLMILDIDLAYKQVENLLKERGHNARNGIRYAWNQVQQAYDAYVNGIV